MARQRKSVMLDAGVVGDLRSVAEKYGVPIASYLRSLVGGALRVEALGYHAPTLLNLAATIVRLFRLGFALVPLELVEDCPPGRAEEVGRRVGAMARAAGLGFDEVLSVLLEPLRAVVREPGRVVLLKSGEGVECVLARLVKGVAEAYGARVREGDRAILIETGGG